MTNILSPGATPVSALAGSAVVRVEKDASLRHAAEIMTEEDVGLLLVGHEPEFGVVSERDITRAVAEGLDPECTRAAEIAHRSLVWCDADTPVAEVAEEMMEQWVRHILIEENGRLIGLVSIRDLLGFYASQDDVE
jgi:CBS domain-containing protein